MLKIENAITLFFQTLARDNDIHSEKMHMSTECRLYECAIIVAKEYVLVNNGMLRSELPSVRAAIIAAAQSDAAE